MAAIKSGLDTAPVFDGVFLDDVWLNATWGGEFLREGTSEPAVLPQAFVDSWHSNMILLLQAVKAAIGSRLLIINGSVYNPDYLDVCDGQMYDSFGHPHWEPPYANYGSDWKHVLDTMISETGRGKIFIAAGGVPAATSQDAKNTVHSYCYNMFLMGAHKNAYFNFTSNYQATPEWIPAWDTDYGVPKSAYAGGPVVFQREYTNGTLTFDSTVPSEPQATYTCPVCGAVEDRKWQLFFIAANPQPPAPLLDAFFCTRFAEPDCLMLFHPAWHHGMVEALDYLQSESWNTVVYDTFSMIGAAWRGNMEPIPHTPWTRTGLADAGPPATTSVGQAGWVATLSSYSELSTPMGFRRFPQGCSMCESSDDWGPAELRRMANTPHKDLVIPVVNGVPASSETGANCKFPGRSFS